MCGRYNFSTDNPNAEKAALIEVISQAQHDKSLHDLTEKVGETE